MEPGRYVRAPSTEEEDDLEVGVEVMDTEETGNLSGGINPGGKCLFMTDPHNKRKPQFEPNATASEKVPAIRLDTKVFPSNIPATQMWSEWRKYIENFEIAASFNGVESQTRRAQLLFLSMGDQLQDIVRAANLMPSFANPQAYNILVQKIDEYLSSMTDVTAEHDSFGSLRQDRGESIVNFHARLVDKARLCGYSAQDRGRFVQSQLIKGMLNREIARESRLYGHDTAKTVLAAARSEAFAAGEGRSEQTNGSVNAVERSPYSKPPVGPNRKWKIPRISERTSKSRVESKFSIKKKRNEDQRSEGRRNRCHRCDRAGHRGWECWFRTQDCYKCGRQGHTTATCHHADNVNSIKEKEENETQKEEQKEV